jgi:hypothetical protein
MAIYEGRHQRRSVGFLRRGKAALMNNDSCSQLRFLLTHTGNRILRVANNPVSWYLSNVEKLKIQLSRHFLRELSAGCIFSIFFLCCSCISISDKRDKVGA